jgi:hypothetical protein
MSAPANSFFRVAGLTYNQYMAISARAFSKVLKPEAAAKRRLDVAMKERTYVAGKPAEKSKWGSCWRGACAWRLMFPALVVWRATGDISDLFTKSIFSKSA